MVGQTGARFGGAAGRRRRVSASLPEDEDSVAVARHPDDEEAVGQTGARFLSRWRQRQGAEQSDPERPDSDQQDPELAAGGTGAKRPPEVPQAVPRPATAPPGPEHNRVSETERASDIESVSDSEWASGADRDVKEAYDLVRPYFWTGGRTASRFELSIETLVSATGQATDPASSPEHRTILALCATPHSVAELAALLSMPLGVARVMLGDMADAGSVVVHRTAGSADAAPDLDLMRRVLAGLQRL